MCCIYVCVCIETDGQIDKNPNASIFFKSQLYFREHLRLQQRTATFDHDGSIPDTCKSYQCHTFPLSTRTVLNDMILATSPKAGMGGSLINSYTNRNVWALSLRVEYQLRYRYWYQILVSLSKVENYIVTQFQCGVQGSRVFLGEFWCWSRAGLCIDRVSVSSVSLWDFTLVLVLVKALIGADADIGIDHGIGPNTHYWHQYRRWTWYQK